MGIGPYSRVGTIARSIASNASQGQNLFDVANDKWIYYNRKDDDFKPAKPDEIVIICIDGKYMGSSNSAASQVVRPSI